WLIDIERGMPSRFTFDAGLHYGPLWSPDGRRVAFSSNRNGVWDLFDKPLNGVGEEHTLRVSAETKVPLSYSPDGRFLLYSSQDPNTGVDLWTLPPAAGGKPFPFVQTPFDETSAQFSPDGRWVAYQSNASGRVEIYVRPFPGPGGQWQV